MTSVKSVMKKVFGAVEQKNVDAAKASLREVSSALSKAVTKGVLKRNTASRRVSRLAAKVNALASVRT
jgi:small subunit ribosomal protein S20